MRIDKYLSYVAENGGGDLILSKDGDHFRARIVRGGEDAEGSVAVEIARRCRIDIVQVLVESLVAQLNQNK